MKQAYKHPSHEVLKALSSSAEGLTHSEAKQRLDKYGMNKLKEAEKPSLFQRFLAQLKDPMLIILLAAAGVSALTGMLAGESEWAEVIIILAVVLLNAVLGVFQESKAEAAIEALQTMTAATCKVLRDGKWRSSVPTNWYPAMWCCWRPVTRFLPMAASSKTHP